MFSICIYAYEYIQNNAIIYPKALGYILYYIRLYNIRRYYILLLVAYFYSCVLLNVCLRWNGSDVDAHQVQ